MKAQNPIQIVVVDDSPYYNRLIARVIESFTTDLSYIWSTPVQVSAFSSAQEFDLQSQQPTHIAVLDYYLGNGVTALDVMKQMRLQNPQCAVLVLSQERNMFTARQTLTQGANGFVQKNEHYAIPKVCLFVESAMSQQLGKAC